MSTTVSAQQPGARAITEDLTLRLQRHYIRPGADMAGGVLVPEVGLNGGYGKGRRCDAIYAGFTSASGRILVGHEVKATRSDWLAELAKVGKADYWADQCHAWYLVTVPGVVRDGELPVGWGLMTPGNARSRLTVQVPATVHEDRQPSWEAVRSIMARLDTLQATQPAQARRAAEEKVTKELSELRQFRSDAQWGSTSTEGQRVAEARLREVEEALGVRFTPDGQREYGRNILPATLTELAALVRDRNGVESARELLVGGYSRVNTDALRRAVDEYEHAVAQLLSGGTGEPL